MPKFVRDSTELPAWRSQFDPAQIETERYLAHFLRNNTTADEDLSRLLAGMILRVVLGVFRPDKFNENDQERLMAELREVLANVKEICDARDDPAGEHPVR